MSNLPARYGTVPPAWETTYETSGVRANVLLYNIIATALVVSATLREIARSLEAFVRSSHNRAAVGAEHLPGHGRRTVGCQERHGGGGVLRNEPPSERLPLDRGIELLVRVHRARSRGVGQSGRYRADGDTGRAETDREAADDA